MSSASGLEEQPHPGLGDDVLGSDGGGQAQPVVLEGPRPSLLDLRVGETGAGHQLTHDLGIGLAGVIEAVGISRGAKGL